MLGSLFLNSTVRNLDLRIPGLPRNAGSASRISRSMFSDGHEVNGACGSLV